MAARKLLQPILFGGLIAGVLDITYACVFSYLRSGRTPAYVFHSVASGLLGRSAYEGGIKTAMMGLEVHFVIAFVVAAVYVLASRVRPFLITQPVISGITYGLCVYAFMYCVILRISAIRANTWRWSYPKSVLIGGLLIHMFGIGLPIALVNRHYSK